MTTQASKASSEWNEMPWNSPWAHDKQYRPCDKLLFQLPVFISPIKTQLVTHRSCLWLAFWLWDPVPLSAKWIVLLEAPPTVSVGGFHLTVWLSLKGYLGAPGARQCADKLIRQLVRWSDSCECTSYGFDLMNVMMASLKSNLADRLGGLPSQGCVVRWSSSASSSSLLTL